MTMIEAVRHPACAGCDAYFVAVNPLTGYCDDCEEAIYEAHAEAADEQRAELDRDEEGFDGE